jgi:hypothetical protein
MVYFQISPYARIAAVTNWMGVWLMWHNAYYRL